MVKAVLQFLFRFIIPPILGLHGMNAHRMSLPIIGMSMSIQYFLIQINVECCWEGKVQLLGIGPLPENR